MPNRHARFHPEWLQLLVDSPIADFTTAPQRLGAIVNVARCSWLRFVPYMLKTNIPVWLYWGVPPAFGQPLDDRALCFAPSSHPQSRARASSAKPVGPKIPSSHAGPSVGPKVPSFSPGQLPGETWKEFITRQNFRRKTKLLKESEKEREMREGREKTAAKKSCPGKKGPSVYIWNEDGGVWTRTLLARREVEDYWGEYRSSQKIFNSIDNCWDLCFEFDKGTAGEIEYDPNDSDDDDVYPDRRKQVHGHIQQPLTPLSTEVVRSGDASDRPSIVVDPCDLEAPTPTSLSVSTSAQVATSSHGDAS